MSRLLDKILNSGAPIREYSTVTIGDEARERVYLDTGGVVRDVSRDHWLLCLEPLIFGVWIAQDDKLPVPAEGNDTVFVQVERDGTVLVPFMGNDCRLYFCPSVHTDGRLMRKNAVAAARLEFFHKVEVEGGCLYLLRLRRTTLHHLPWIKTHFLFWKYYKKPLLTFARYASYITGFSYPRQVRLISFREEGYYNIFPMDLVGEIRPGHTFVFGLRHTNIALAKIILSRRMVVAEVPAAKKDMIYALGKHHSTAAPAVDKLPFPVFCSEELGFYLPEWVESYKEITIRGTMNLGSHMLLWGEWTKEVKVNGSSPHLHHIHFLQYLHQRGRGEEYEVV
jgi:hypothetical protein